MDTALFLVATVLGAIVLVQTKATSLLGWAVVALGVGLLWGTNF